MTLAHGDRLGSYEVLGKLGEGGMGEVYRARDTKLNRDIAIKVLPEAFALDADRVARFTREAQVLASLNHPNIAGIYGIEEPPVQGPGSKVQALVMELVEGQDLSEMIFGAPGLQPGGPTAGAKAPALHLTDALAIARQIADALEAAHEQGIIHRDLKPQNIKVRADGTVKVLDFGLAKAMDPPSPAATAGKPGNPGPWTPDPGLTMTSPAMTAMGMIIGTAAYMAPEQARGRAVDRRADIWAFGVVLYEMLTGRRAFEGEDISVTLANVIKETPTFDALPPNLPASVRRLLRRCLEKDPKRRLSSIGDARLELDDATLPSEGPSAAPPDRAPVRSSTLQWGIAGTLAVALIAVAVWLWPQAAEAPAAIQFTVDPPEGSAFSPGHGFLSVSPDGRHVAYATGTLGNEKLWLRSVGALEARPVPAADGAWHVAWSPDSESIVYTQQGGAAELRRVDLAGGPARTLATVASERPAWGRGGVIVFRPGTSSQGLMRVPEAGGPAMPATELNAEAGERFHSWPVFLPDGKRFIFVARGDDRSKARLFLASLDSKERTHLLDVFSMVDLVPGYLVYHRDGTLYAHPFDEDSGRLTGDPVPIVEDVQTNAGNGRVAMGTSRTGLLAYRTGESNANPSLVTWLDRTGKVVATIGQPAEYRRGALSPDGRRFVVPVDTPTGRDLVMIDVARNITSRFTSDDGFEESPVWTNDGESVVFSSYRKGVADLYLKNAGGATPDRPLFESMDDKSATGFSPDGRVLLFSAGRVEDRSVWALPIGGDAKPYRVFPDDRDTHSSARFSPDGQWIAYQAGTPPNVFVQPFPATGYREQISATEGTSPQWTADGRQIAFVGPDRRVMIADVTPAGGRLRVSAPRELFRQVQRTGASGFTMDARAERFLMVVSPAATGDSPPAPVTVIANWPSLVIKK